MKVTAPSELLDFLLSKMGGMKRNAVKSLLRHRQVSVDDKITTRHDHVLQPGQVVTVSRERGTVELTHPKVRIIYEDSHLIAIEKKENLLTVRTDNGREPTAFSILKKHVQRASEHNRIYTVHRLDRETSGVLVFAKNRQIQLSLQESWHSDVKRRLYVAVVEGRMKEAEGTVTSWLTENEKSLKVRSSPTDDGGRQAVTHYRLIKSNDNYSLLEIELGTGRKNQIRVHMQSLRHPVAGDKRYGATTNPIGRLALHARILEFIHPVTGETMHFETPVPRKFLHLFH